MSAHVHHCMMLVHAYIHNAQVHTQPKESTCLHNLSSFLSFHPTKLHTYVIENRICRLLYSKGKQPHAHLHSTTQEYLIHTYVRTYLHTSDALEYTDVRITSGAIHANVPAPLMCVVCWISLARPKSVIRGVLPCRLRGSTSRSRRTAK